MSVNGHMHMSLVSLIESFTTSSHTRSTSPSYGTFHECFSENLMKLNMVILIWGENDRLRSASPNQIPPTQARRELRPKDIKDKKPKIKHQNLEWTGDHLQESEFMTFLQVNGINCEGYEVEHVPSFFIFESN